MSDEFDLNAIVLIGAAFIVGYLVVGALMSRGKRGRTSAARRETGNNSTTADPLASAAERETRARQERDAENQRIQEAAQRLREQAAERAREEERRRGGR
jgi:FtsZ-interacting cell division protein ZipA